MGLNHISIAAVIALLGAAPALHAETATQPANTPATGPAVQGSPTTGTTPPPSTVPPTSVTDPALTASPVEGTTQAAPPAAAPETTAPATTKGDVLKVPKKKPAAKKKKAPSKSINIEEDGMPGRGASMTQVEQRFGKPREKVAPVGNPPISRWIYSNYTVYFEREYVIHSVRNEAAAETVPAQPVKPSTQQPAAPTVMAPAPTEQVAPPPLQETPETVAPPAAGATEAKPASGQ